MARICIILVLSCLLPSSGVLATPSPSLHLGTLPMPNGEAIWRIAAPLDGTVEAFETADSRLAVESSPIDDRSWLVLTADTEGPVAGLLRLRDDDGHVHAVSVAGDVVEPSAFDGFLFRGSRPGDEIERYVVAGGSDVLGIDVPAAWSAHAAAHQSGWTRVAVQLPIGIGECDGTLRLGGGAPPVPVHVSLLESISVLGMATLDAGFEPLRARAIDERLQTNGSFTGVVGVLGRRQDALRLRVLAADGDGQGVSLSSLGVHDVGAVNPGDVVHLSPIRHLGGDAVGSRFLVVSPGRATILSPFDGFLARRQDASLARIGAVHTSRLNRNRVFAITGNGSGEWFLSKLRAQRSDGVYDVQHTRYLPSLQELLGGRELRIGDMSGVRYATGGRENLLVSVGRPGGDLRIVELLPDHTSVRARVRHAFQAADPSGLRDVRIDFLPSPRAGSGSFPAQARLMVPNQELRVLRVDARGGWTILGRETIGGTAIGSGVALETPTFLLGGRDGQGNTDLIRYEFDGKILQARALGRASGVSVRQYEVSKRREHAWLLGTDRRGRGRVRFVTNGLVAGTNLPPVVDAGPDVQTTRRRIRLRANVRDANGDPVSVRWSGAGVEFTDRFARRTTALVPPGRTRVRIFAREEALPFLRAAQLEDMDALVVRYDNTVSTAPAGASGLVTALGHAEPNPACAHTIIPFTLETRARARVDVFDVSGRHVTTLLDDALSAGGHDVVWHGTHSDGTPAAEGVYFFRLVTGRRSLERRVVLVR